MKHAFLYLVLFAGLVGGCSERRTADKTAETAAAAQEQYTCPMHPSVISDRPGACPVCGMSLVRVSAQTEMREDEAAGLSRVSLSPTQRVLANVSTATAVRGDITRNVSLVGFVDVAEPNEATVAARFRGRIEKLHASTTGERVRAGDPLFELYSPDLVTSVREFLLALDAGPARLAEDPTLLQGVRARLRLNYGMTDRQIREIEETRELRTTVTFYSPLTGTILEKNVREGAYVNEGEVLYRVADLSRVWIMLDVYENDIRHIRPGQTVVITTDAYPGDRFSGRITFIDPVMNTTTRTTRVRTEFGNKHGRLMPNMFVTAGVEVREEDQLLIPRTAVLETGRRSVVWVETSPNTFEPRTVEVGFRGDQSVSVASGLRPGDRVAVSGGFLIDSESSLQQGGAGMGHQHGGMEGSGDKTDAVRTQDDTTVVTITVKGTYTPEVIHVKKGTPLRLRFFRNETSACTKEVQFPELGIRKTLADFDTTEIRITPTKVGTIHFSCGMDMVHGRLIVEEGGDRHD